MTARTTLRFGLASLRPRAVLVLVAWSVPEVLPSAASGFVVARAVDDGFLAGRPMLGAAWLGALMLAAGIGALGSRQVYRCLGGLTEPFRDVLVRRVVGGALRNGVAGRPDDGALARLTRQVELVRDAYAGLIVAVRGFVVTVVAVVIGLLSIAPVVAALILPPFLLGFGAFLLTLGMAATRYRRAVHADERLAETTGQVLAGVRDLVARGAEGRAVTMVSRPIRAQAETERALARTAALRTLCFAIGGWLPLVVVLAAGPWLAGRGLTAGAIMGGLTYVLVGLQPALQTLVSAIGASGLRFVVTLERILEASTPPPTFVPSLGKPPEGYALRFRGVSFAYGPHADPVLRELDLDVPTGDHLAIVGPSGIGKSTLANLLCGLLKPDSGSVDVSGDRVLIPQEAYVFTGTARQNLCYLRTDATTTDLDDAVHAIGAEALLERLGGYDTTLAPAELSAGERQLIALVRAYVADAPLVILDEATCHLDPTAERRAEEAFASRPGTLIVIAHRISSAQRARRILVLDGGHATVGRHQILLSTSTLYQELVGHWNVAPSAVSELAPAATVRSAGTGPAPPSQL